LVKANEELQKFKEGQNDSKDQMLNDKIAELNKEINLMKE
jgi:hypothetical protein